VRRVHRQALPAAVDKYLQRKAQGVAAGRGGATEWEKAQKTKTIGTHLVAVLRAMAGKRERCMYCNDSRGTDVEHFWPKATYPEKTFNWQNMLLACTGCNRKKGDRFPLDSQGRALLIDPSLDDPWELLDFIPETGELTARWRTDIDAFHPRGEATVDATLLPLNIEAVTTGRQRCWRALRGAIERFLKEAASVEVVSSESPFDRLKREILERSEYGLSRWLFCFCSISEPWLDRLRAYPEQWEELREMSAL